MLNQKIEKNKFDEEMSGLKILMNLKSGINRESKEINKLDINTNNPD